MDDFVNSVASEEEAVEVYKNLLKSLADRGFQLRKCNRKRNGRNSFARQISFAKLIIRS